MTANRKNRLIVKDIYTGKACRCLIGVNYVRPRLRSFSGIKAGLAVLTAVCISLAALGTYIFISKPQIAQNAIIKNTIIKQTSAAIANQPVKWITLIKRSQIKQDQYLVQLPKTAKNIKVRTITKEQAQDILSRPTPNPQNQLTLNDRKKLPVLSQKASWPGQAVLSSSRTVPASSGTGAWFAGIEQAAEQLTKTITQKIITIPKIEAVEEITETIAPEIIKTEEATFVDLSDQIIQEPTPTPTPTPFPEEPSASLEPTPTPVDSGQTEEQPVEQTQEEQAQEQQPEQLEQSEQPELRQEEEKYVEIEHETLAPEITEQETDKGKLVVVSSLDETQQYTNVLAYTNIPEIFKVGQENKIKIKWQNNGNQDVEFNAYDLNNNGKLDYIEWTVPHLSEQIFEIIFISKAFELDADKNIINDIYDQVQTQDNNWATVPQNNYVRVTFEQVLTNNNDITLYARPSSTPMLESEVNLTPPPVEQPAPETPSIESMNPSESLDQTPTDQTSPTEQLTPSLTPDATPEPAPTLPAETTPPKEPPAENPAPVENPASPAEEPALTPNSETPSETPDSSNIVEPTSPPTETEQTPSDQVSQNSAGFLASIFSAFSKIGSSLVADKGVRIEVYPVYTDQDGNTTEGPLVATFENINQENTYKIYLTNLQTPTDVFDLKIIGNVDIDYIVDPGETRYWVGGGSSTNWDATGNTNWSATSGGPNNASIPASGDDVFFNNGADCVVNVATNQLNSLDMTGYTGVLSGASNITITVASGTSTVLFAGTSPTWSGILNLNPAAGTTINLTFGGLTTCGGITIAGTTTGAVFMLDAITLAATKIVTLTSGTLHTDGALDNSGFSHSWGKFTTAAGTKTLILGNSTITITGTATPWSWSITSATLNEMTSIIILNGVAVTFGGGGDTYYDVRLTGSGTAVITGGNTFTNLTRTATAVKTDYLQLNSSQTVNGALALNGNTAINRLYVLSNTFATTRIFTLGASATCKTNSSKVDFRDITMFGGAAGERDLSAIAGGSGDCGGNTGITFTTATNWYWKTAGAGTYNMENYLYWFTATNGGGSQMASTLVPLPQDNLRFDSSSVTGATTINQNMPRVCTNLDFTGVGVMNLNINNTSQIFYGSLTLVTNLGVTSGTNITFQGRNSLFYLDAAGKYTDNIIAQCYNGTLLLSSNHKSNYVLSVYAGTFDANDYDVTTGRIDTSTGTTINMGNGTWYIHGQFSGEIFRLSATMTALNAEGSTLYCNYAGTATTTLDGKGYTFNNVTFKDKTTTGQWTIISSNTFNVFTVGTGNTIKFTDGTDTTVQSFVAPGTALAGITLNGTSTAGWKLSDTTGTNTVYNCAISYSTGEGGATWSAVNSTNVVGNSGWVFTTRKYWVGGGLTADWNATGATNWGSVSNIRDNAAVPISTDDVIFDNSANGDTPCTLSASTEIKSLVMTGWANTLTHNLDVNLTINGQDASGNSLLMVSGMTYTLGAATTSAITFTGAGTSKITTGTKIVGNLTFNNPGGTFQLQDGLTVSNTLTSTAGTFAYAAQTVSTAGFTITSGLVTRTTGTFNGGNLTADGTILTFPASATFSGNVTATYPKILLNGSTFNGTTNQFTETTTLSTTYSAGGNTFGAGSTTTFTNTGTQNWYLSNNSGNTYNGNIQFENTNIGLIWIAASNVTSTLADGKTISIGTTNGFTNGYLVLSYFIQTGTQAQTLTLTGTGIVSFGVNTTFNGNLTVSADRILFSGSTFNGTTNQFTNTSTSNPSVGTGADTFIAGSTNTFTNSGNQIWRFAGTDADNYYGNVEFKNTSTGTIQVAYAGTNTFGGNLTLTPGSGTITVGAGGGTVTLTGTGSQTLTSGGVTFPDLTQNGAAGTYTLQDNLTVSGTLTLTAGTFAYAAKTVSTAGFTITGGIVTRTSGTFNGGNLTATGTVLTFPASATFSGNVTATYAQIYLNGSTFNGTTNQFTYTSTTVSTTSGGGNTFGAGSTTTFTNTGAYIWYLGYNSNNIFNGNIQFENTSVGQIRLTAGTCISTLADGKTISIGPNGFISGGLYLKNLIQTGNQAQTLTLAGTTTAIYFQTGTTFNGNLTVSAPTISLDGATFNGTTNQFTETGSTTTTSTGGNTFGASSTTTFTNTGSGIWYLANTGANTFNGDIKFESTSTGQIYLTTTTSTSTLADGKTISIGAVNGFTNGYLYLGYLTQTGTTAQTLTLTSSARIYFQTGTTFGGSLTVSAPRIYLNGSTFNGTTNQFTNTSSVSDSAGTGGNTFGASSTTTFTVTGTEYLALSSSTGTNTFNGDIKFESTSTGQIYTTTGTGISTLADGKTISIGATNGFTNGQLYLGYLTQTGTTAQTLTLTGSGRIYFQTGNTFNGSLTVSAPQIYLNGSTFNGTTNGFTNTGTGVTSTGANIFGAGSSNTFTLGSTGTWRFAGTNPDIYNGNATFVNSSTGAIQVAYAGTNTFGGNLTLTPATGIITVGAGAGTAQFTAATGTQTLDSGLATIAFPTVTHTGAGILQLTGHTLKIGTSLDNSAGTFDLNGQSLTTTGATFTNSATLQLTGAETVGTVAPTLNTGSTVIYTSGSAQTIQNWTYTNAILKINGAGTFSLPASITTAGINIAAGTLDASTSNYTITNSGNWTNAGTFTPRAGTVILSGASQKIFGSTTFYNLTKDISAGSADTLMFENSKTQTISASGTLTLKGASGKVLTLRSCNSSGVQSDGTQWSINPQGTRTISYLDVKDSNNTNGTGISTAGLNITDSGNNTNWLFSITPPTTQPQQTAGGGGVAHSPEELKSNLIQKIKEEAKKILDKLIDIAKQITELPGYLIPEFLKPKPQEEAKLPELPPIEEVVSKEAPLSMQGKWDLLPREPIESFVLSPLPREIRELAGKFPELGETLKKLGITKITDIEKLKTVKLTLPGLTEKVGLPIEEIQPGKFALPKGVPVAKLSPQAKQQLPTEIVFTKTGGELIDFNIALSVNEKGEPQQKISTISGKPLQLVVKPDKPVKSVKGYVVFKSKPSRPTSYEFPLNSLTASLIFANPAFAQTQEKPVRTEELLVLTEFEYTDPDGDGIYTAEIQAPVVEGEYEIITVMDFEDPKLGKKEIRLITVVDPEGYVHTRIGNQELRIKNAIVSLFWLNLETKEYQLWPAKEYQQENPQITDITGKYSFLVPEGTYYLKVEAPGYLVYEGETFGVKESSGIHKNIELKNKLFWLRFDWQTILLVFVTILLLIITLLLFYNFYRDKIREKLLRK